MLIGRRRRAMRILLLATQQEDRWMLGREKRGEVEKESWKREISGERREVGR
jgi:hypothetical protein